MGQKCVLLVEDDVDFRLLMTEIFSDAGFDVVEAEDGDQAVEMLERIADLDLLVTDIQIPGRFDGNGVATKAKHRRPNLPVVYMSGRPETLTNRIGPRDTFVSKPFLSSRLFSEIGRLMDTAEPH